MGCPAVWAAEWCLERTVEDARLDIRVRGQPCYRRNLCVPGPVADRNFEQVCSGTGPLLWLADLLERPADEGSGAGSARMPVCHRPRSVLGGVLSGSAEIHGYREVCDGANCSSQFFHGNALHITLYYIWGPV